MDSFEAILDLLSSRFSRPISIISASNFASAIQQTRYIYCAFENPRNGLQTNYRSISLLDVIIKYPHHPMNIRSPSWMVYSVWLVVDLPHFSIANAVSIDTWSHAQLGNSFRPDGGSQVGQLLCLRSSVADMGETLLAIRWLLLHWPAHGQTHTSHCPK